MQQKSQRCRLGCPGTGSAPGQLRGSAGGAGSGALPLRGAGLPGGAVLVGDAGTAGGCCSAAGPEGRTGSCLPGEAGGLCGQAPEPPLEETSRTLRLPRVSYRGLAGGLRKWSQ